MTKPKSKPVRLLDETTNKVNRMYQYGGKLGTVPALFTFRRDYILKKACELSLLTGILDHRCLAPNGKLGLLMIFMRGAFLYRGCDVWD